MDETFDPALHRRYETRWFENFAIGEKFILPSRTMTDAIFLARRPAATTIRSTTMSNFVASAECRTCWHMGIRS